MRRPRRSVKKFARLVSSGESSIKTKLKPRRKFARRLRSFVICAAKERRRKSARRLGKMCATHVKTGKRKSKRPIRHVVSGVLKGAKRGAHVTMRENSDKSSERLVARSEST
jgi:hypothetical protein